MRRFGKYRLVEPLASGGMADVWRAEVTLAEGVVKEVALKLVRGEHAEKSEFVRMFVQEARLAARLSHANVVQVFEFDQVGGRYYIAMELVRGRHLGQVVERARERGVRLGVPRAVHVGAEVARALAYAHRLADGGRPLGLVHRDVSPHNVLVSFEGEVKLADFGIARAMNLGDRTDPGTVKGKLAYMAPEQARGAAVDARADVFSLGVVLWELCAGRRLFARETDAATLAAVLGTEPLGPPSAWNEDVPAELDAAVLGALERDPERRIRSAQDLAGALAAVLLRVTRTPDEVDLRAFVQRLFAEEAARAASGAPAADATVVRPAPLAREPVAEASPAPADGAAADGAAAARGGPAPDEGETRTAQPAPASRGRAVAIGAAVAAALAVGGVVATTALPAGAGRGVEDARSDHGSSSSSTSAATSSPTSIAIADPIPTPTSTSTPTSGPAPDPSASGPAASTPAPASTAAAQPSHPERGGPEARPAGGRDVKPLEWVHAVGRLATPAAQSGEGVLFVNATPWGTVVVNGYVLGETPQEVRLPAGRHRVRVERPNQRGVEAEVTVEAGRRTKLLQ